MKLDFERVGLYDYSHIDKVRWSWEHWILHFFWAVFAERSALKVPMPSNVEGDKFYLPWRPFINLIPAADLQRAICFSLNPSRPLWYPLEQKIVLSQGHKYITWLSVNRLSCKNNSNISLLYIIRHMLINMFFWILIMVEWEEWNKTQ